MTTKIHNCPIHGKEECKNPWKKEHHPIMVRVHDCSKIDALPSLKGQYAIQIRWHEWEK
jgi:hypothetical protein